VDITIFFILTLTAKATYKTTQTGILIVQLKQMEGIYA